MRPTSGKPTAALFSAALGAIAVAAVVRGWRHLKQGGAGCAVWTAARHHDRGVGFQPENLTADGGILAV
jgi:hypothetical protein